MLMLGGIGSTSGMIIGAILVTILPELLRFMGDYYQLVFYGIALLLLLVYPLGLSHLFSQLKKKAAAFFAGLEENAEGGLIHVRTEIGACDQALRRPGCSQRPLL